MKHFVLDTDHVSLFQRGDPRVTERVQAAPSQFIAVTIVTVEEQVRGWLKAVRKASTREQFIYAYQRLDAAVKFFAGLRVLLFDEESYEEYQRLRSQRIRIGTQDLRIAALALSNNAILLTRNVRDYSRIPDLVIEDWSVPRRG